MKRKARVVIEDEFFKALQDLFVHYAGSETTQHPIEEPDVVHSRYLYHDSETCVREMVSSSIGFGGHDFRCSIGLLARRETVAAMCGGELYCATDWIGELANQLIGRLKNNVAAYNSDTSMGMPVSIQGTDLRFTQQSPDQMMIEVDTPNGNILVLLQISVDEEVEWEFDEESLPAEEGSMSLF